MGTLLLRKSIASVKGTFLFFMSMLSTLARIFSSSSAAVSFLRVSGGISSSA